jgi:hypothetical protein
LPSLPAKNLAYPVHIAVPAPGKSNPVSVGSGFYYSHPNALYFVTAKHVLFENGLELYGDEAVLTSALAGDLKAKIAFKLDCRSMLASGTLKKHSKADVAVAKIGTMSSDNQNNMVVSFMPDVSVAMQPAVSGDATLRGMAQNQARRFDQVGISNGVIMFGYPASLGTEAQIDRERPLLRRGIVAGKTEDGRVIIDCPCYKGNSGALVVELDERIGSIHFYGIGVVVEHIPFVEELVSKQFKITAAIRFENSGYSLVEPMDRVEELLT